MRKILLLALAAVSAAGCAISINTPTVRFQSPEVTGRAGGGSLGFAVAGSRQLVVVPDTTAQPPTEARDFSRGGVAAMLGDVGLSDRLDLEIILNASFEGAAPQMARLKYQLLGDPVNSTKAGNSSLAFSLGGGYGSSTDTDNNTLVTPNILAETSTHLSMLDLAVIAGYRATDAMLFYGGPFISRYWYSADLTQSGGGSARASFSGASHVGGLNLGLQLGNGWFLSRFEVAFTGSSAAGIAGGGANFGAMLGARW